jgi:uncharacterized protein YraI
MKNRTQIRSLITAIFLAACAGQSTPPAAPTSTAFIPTDVIPGEPTSTVTSIPLPADQGAPTATLLPLPLPGDSLPTATFFVQVPAAGGNGPFASTNGVTVNCRTGPDLIWAVTEILNPGQNVEIAGRNNDASWWLVKVPSALTGVCWVSASYVTVNGNVSTVPIATVDPGVAYTALPRIVSVSIIVEPNVIEAPGCVGPVEPLNISAKIGTNGPVQVKLHFEDEQLGELPTRWMTFTRADIQDLTQTYTPPILEEGTFFISLVVEDMDTDGLGPITYYTVDCT